MLDPHELVSLYYPRPKEFGRLALVESESVPQPFQQLLVHEHHMTVTMEAYYGCSVEVEVIAFQEPPPAYTRQILLRTSTSRTVIQFGIVRLFPERLDSPVYQAIRARQIPLGRILIDQDVMRSVILERIWCFQPEAAVATLLGMACGVPTYGRTARILVNNLPTIDLLEIVVPPT